MTISVIIPAYNAARYIREAVDSVLSQSRPVDEILVVDDGSTDDTSTILSPYKSPVKVISIQHGGQAAARNAGVLAATGETLAFLDSDDIWTADKIERQIDHLDRHDMVFGMLEQFISSDLLLEEQANLVCPPAPQSGMVCGTLLIRNETFQRVGWFDEALRLGEFVDWYCKAQDIGLRSYVCPAVVLRRRLHTGNTTLTERDTATDYVHILRAALERRRAMGR